MTTREVKKTTIYVDGSKTIVSLNTTVQAAAPTLTSNGTTISSVQLSWTPNSNGDAVVEKYNLYQADVLLLELTATTLTHTVTGLTSNTAFFFKIQKVTSLNTTVATVLASTLGVQPTAPTITTSNLTAVSVDLTWTAGDNGDAQAQKFIVYSNGANIGEVSIDTLIFTVVDLTPETSYTFKVRKTTTLGNAESGDVSVQTLEPPAVPEYQLSDTASVHSIVYPGWDAIMWADGTAKGIRSDLGNQAVGTDIVLKTPHALENMTGTVRQVISLANYVISLDTDNKLYVMAIYSTGSSKAYTFMVDGSATTQPTNWMGNAESNPPIPRIFYEAAQLQTLLTPLYGSMAIRAIHDASNDIFLIEYEDMSIHLVHVNNHTNTSSEQRYYSPTVAQTVTGLVGDWELSNVVRGGSSALVFMKRKFAVAPYKAFQTDTTQYGKDDVSDGNNVRVFTLHFYSYVSLFGGFASDLYSDLYSGVLSSSSLTMSYVRSNAGSGSRLSYDGRESLLQYWCTYHLKRILEEGFLPTKTIDLNHSVLVLFEKENGDKEWHLFNNTPNEISGTYDERHKRSAQYLLATSLDGYSGAQTYSTILFMGTREAMLASPAFVRLQSVMTAFENAGQGLDDLVFVNSLFYSRYSGRTLNSTQLQAYVKSINKTFTLGNPPISTQDVVVTVKSKATGGYLHPYNFTLEDESGGSIPYTITDNMGTFIDFNDHPNAKNAVTQNGYTINYYKTIPNDQYAIGDTFTLSYDVTKTVRKVHIGNYIDSRSVDVQIQVGGQTVLVAATTSTSDGGSSHGAAIQEATFDSLGSAPLPNYLVEVTDTVLSADSYNYIDMKNSPAQTSWGPATRLHNWLFANDQFATVPLKAMYLTQWGFIAVTDVSTAPRAPTVSVGAVTVDSVVINWLAEGNGEAVVQKYVVLLDGAVVGEVSENVLTHTAEGLESNTSYEVIVRKVTDMGNVDSPAVIVETLAAVGGDVIIKMLSLKGSSNLNLRAIRLVDTTTGDELPYTIEAIGFSAALAGALTPNGDLSRLYTTANDTGIYWPSNSNYYNIGSYFRLTPTTPSDIYRVKQVDVFMYKGNRSENIEVTVNNVPNPIPKTAVRKTYSENSSYWDSRNTQTLIFP